MSRICPGVGGAGLRVGVSGSDVDAVREGVFLDLGDDVGRHVGLVSVLQLGLRIGIDALLLGVFEFMRGRAGAEVVRNVRAMSMPLAKSIVLKQY